MVDVAVVPVINRLESSFKREIVLVLQGSFQLVHSKLIAQFHVKQLAEQLLNRAG